jgi:uncharacterized OB-fold protein
MSDYDKPLPHIESWGEKFWRIASEEHELSVASCDDCDETFMYPKKFCENCGSDAITMERRSGPFSLYSWSHIENVPHPDFEDVVPYTMGVIEIEDSVRILAQVETDDPYELECDIDVDVYFDEVTDDIAIPKFIPVEEA